VEHCEVEDGWLHVELNVKNWGERDKEWKRDFCGIFVIADKEVDREQWWDFIEQVDKEDKERNDKSELKHVKNRAKPF
jgi:hypothetical protein